LNDNQFIPGVIPKQRYNVSITLKATADLDINVFDVLNTTEYEEGRAIVAWCSLANGTCNLGVLGNNDDAAGTYYYQSNGLAPMWVEYSGYNGVASDTGHEWLKIEGETMTDMRMSVWAFATGSATLTYTWEGSRSACCLGVEQCGGSFKRQLAEGTLAIVGEVPIGIVDLYILLKSEEDIDIQVLDTSNTTLYPEGQALIGWCDASNSTCNLGYYSGSMVGSIVIDGITIEYSGYNGIDKSLGNEYIRYMVK